MNRELRTELHYAAFSNDGELVERLVSHGFDLNARDSAGFTPLHFAAQEWSLEAATVLLTGGADVDPVNQYGNTPLHVAVFNSRGRGELIDLLRQSGADPTKPNNYGQTPLGLAQLIANYDLEQFFDAPAPKPDPR